MDLIDVMRILYLLALLLTAECSVAQNKVIDDPSCLNWPSILSPAISGDGKYVAYLIKRPGKETVLDIVASDESWKKSIIVATRLKGNNFEFTDNSRWFVFNQTDDSIGILDLQNYRLQYIAQVGSSNFKVAGIGDTVFLSYSFKNSENSLHVLNLYTNKENIVHNTGDYKFSISGDILITQSIEMEDSMQVNNVSWIDLVTGRIKTVARGIYASNFVFNANETAVAFVAERDKNNPMTRSIRCFILSGDSADVIVDSAAKGMEGKYVDKQDPLFKLSDEQIFFYTDLTKPGVKAPKKSGEFAHVDIWNYKDGDHVFDFEEGPFLAVASLAEKGAIIQLQQQTDRTRWMPQDRSNNYILFVSDYFSPMGEYKWRESARPNLYLVSTKDGSRVLIKRRLVGKCVGFSTGGKYVIWYDAERMQWVTYNLLTKVTKGITEKINVPLYPEQDRPESTIPYDIGGWGESDATVLMYDRFDIWSVDPDGVKSPVNITHGFGRRNDIQLRYLNFTKDSPRPIGSKDTIIVSAFDLKIKESGFFSLSMENNRSLKKLIMEPRVFYFPFPNDRASFNGFGGQFFPLKAKIANTYLLRPMSPGEYPNISVTNDFVRFKSMSSLHPERGLNWYTTELVRWKLFDGKPAEGILYKPENFDPNVKYPIIFFYYERNANAVNVFLNAALSDGPMNIPYFVSRGYLVFVPDVYYKIGYPGRSAYNSVVSAAMYLIKKPWVDAMHMGLQGHSYGGFETNYIVSHSHLFAAAVTAEGVSDFVSAYGQLNDRDGLEFYYETEQGRIGASLWKRPELYIENSAIFKADKVTTPLFILHNMKDMVVYFNQGAAWYSCLHRLGKKVWMISYEGEGHVLGEDNDKLDFSIRLEQFFDYYLKGSAPPVWMTTGVPRQLKGIDDGLEPDNSGKKP
jgi:dienelactone hydrolase